MADLKKGDVDISTILGIALFLFGLALLLWFVVSSGDGLGILQGEVLQSVEGIN